MEAPGSLQADNILIAEFEYIAQSAFQVSEDRAKVSSFYLVTVASIFAAILGANIEGADSQSISLIFALLFLFLAFNGFLTLLKLAQLRLAWLDSVKAMNAIKQYYEQCCPKIKENCVFKWRTESLPHRFKIRSLSFAIAVEVVFLGGVTLGTSVIFWGRVNNSWMWNEALRVGLAYLLMQLLIYALMLTNWSRLLHREVR